MLEMKWKFLLWYGYIPKQEFDYIWYNHNYSKMLLLEIVSGMLLLSVMEENKWKHIKSYLVDNNIKTCGNDWMRVELFCTLK